MSSDFNIAILCGGVAFRATRRPYARIDVTDGFLTIKFRDNVPLKDYPKISAIEVVQTATTPVAVATKAPVTNAPVTRAPVTKAPVTKAPVTKAPVTKAPVTKAPVTQAPVAKAPVMAPVIKAPVLSPKAPSAPVMAPRAPVLAPAAPVVAPKAPAAAPLAMAPVAAPTGFAPVLINCGGGNYTDSFGRTWMSDRYFTAGFPYANPAAAIADTVGKTLLTTLKLTRTHANDSPNSSHWLCKTIFIQLRKIWALELQHPPSGWNLYRDFAFFRDLVSLLLSSSTKLRRLISHN
jgi:hypothetical protein